MADQIIGDGNESNQNSKEVTGTSSKDTQAEAVKTYTQEEFDAHMAGLRSSLEKKFTKKFEELGDLEELKKIKHEYETRQVENAKKRGDFDKVMQDLAAKKDAEIAKRDQIIADYRINTPLVNAAAEYRSVNPQQVQSLLKQSVRLTQDGEVEVVDEKGTVRYTDNGSPMTVKDLVKSFLDANPHFVQPTPATTNSKSSVNAASGKFDPSKLDMSNPDDRAAYKEYRKQAGLA